MLYVQVAMVNFEHPCKFGESYKMLVADFHINIAAIMIYVAPTHSARLLINLIAELVSCGNFPSTYKIKTVI